MTTEAMSRVSTWIIDPTHSIAEFAVKHFVVTRSPAGAATRPDQEVAGRSEPSTGDEGALR